MNLKGFGGFVSAETLGYILTIKPTIIMMGEVVFRKW